MGFRCAGARSNGVIDVREVVASCVQKKSTVVKLGWVVSSEISVHQPLVRE